MAIHPKIIADDYAMTPAISAGILTLLKSNKISGTSCMTIAPAWREAATDLRCVHHNSGGEIGLHFTLTGTCFKPLAQKFRDCYGCSMPTLDQILTLCYRRKMIRDAVFSELNSQYDAFVEYFEKEPDFIDGHQHVHILPVVRNTLMDFLKNKQFQGWIRQCCSIPSLIYKRPCMIKSAILTAMSVNLKKEFNLQKIPCNHDFCGVYNFNRYKNFHFFIDRWLASSTAETIIMCHPADPTVKDKELHDDIAQARHYEFHTLKSIISFS